MLKHLHQSARERNDNFNTDTITLVVLHEFSNLSTYDCNLTRCFVVVVKIPHFFYKFNAVILKCLALTIPFLHSKYDEKSKISAPMTNEIVTSKHKQLHNLKS